ncbi:hypothetical protein U1Q18_004016, partial [Sarracenia purpurea var. burkii]
MELANGDDEVRCGLTVIQATTIDSRKEGIDVGEWPRLKGVEEQSPRLKGNPEAKAITGLMSLLDWAKCSVNRRRVEHGSTHGDGWNIREKKFLQARD